MILNCIFLGLGVALFIFGCILGYHLGIKERMNGKPKYAKDWRVKR